MSAKTTEVTNLTYPTEFGREIGLVNEDEIQKFVEDKAYRITLVTICGIQSTTVFDDEFDSPDCVHAEWEMKNKELCGR